MSPEDYDRSRAAFAAYAGMDAPELPPHTWSAVQVRLYRWQVRNFGCQPSWTQVLGIVEELGELGEALDTYAALCGPRSTDGIEDAFADTMIFATQLATGHRLDFGILWTVSEAVDTAPGAGFRPSALMLQISVGRLAHIMLKVHQKIRGFDDDEKARVEVARWLTQLLAWLRNEVRATVPDPERTYITIAEKVMQRNWRKDQLTAGGQ